jgi:hypothetical protein
MISAQTFGKWLKSNGITTLSGFVDNSCVVHVVNAMVSASPAMMKELRRLKRELDELGITISLSWLPSALNYYADLLSRSWDPGDLQCTRTVLRGLLDGGAVSDATPVFRYRPLNEHPTYLRRSLLEDLNRPWTDGLARLYNPPADLATPVLLTMRREWAAGIVVLPYWPTAPWYGLLYSMATSLTVAEPAAADDVRSV